MSEIRKVQKTLKSQPTLEGAGVALKRAFGFRHGVNLDPFLLLDHFHSSNPADYIKGFPWHPHRGIETITYMLAGKVEHGDSMGNRGVISTGDVQWMTAGSGIIHQEMPKGGEGNAMAGFQLWANLPAANKMMDPRYRDVRSESIPAVELASGATVRVICGQVGEVRGPVQDIVTDPEYLDVSLPGGTTFSHPVRRGYNVFAYVFSGDGCFDPQAELAGGPETLVLFEDGDEVTVTAGAEGLRFLLVSGKPIGEPVAWYGPIVMNTTEELRLAFDELNRGTFLKHQQE